MRRFSAEEKNDQQFRKVLQTISTEPDTIRHSCTKCRIGKPSMECSDCFALLCQGCVRFYGHDPSHKMTFHHPENLPQNIIPGQPANRLPPDLELAGLIPGGRRERAWKQGLGEQLKQLSDSGSENDSVGDIRDTLSRTYKALRTDAVARALFERSVRVCHDCNFEIFDVDKGHAHDFHTNVTEPEPAAEAIKAIFSEYKLSGPTFAKRGEEAQHLCIVEKVRALSMPESPD